MTLQPQVDLQVPVYTLLNIISIIVFTYAAANELEAAQGLCLVLLQWNLKVINTDGILIGERKCSWKAPCVCARVCVVYECVLVLMKGKHIGGRLTSDA